MSDFIVSARKYRPSTFDEVVGQFSITATLKNAIKSNQLAQSFLFCGPRGVGKTSCARILAKTINCENISDNIEACENCVSCKSFNDNSSFNVHELDAASNNSVDDIRKLVSDISAMNTKLENDIYLNEQLFSRIKHVFDSKNNHPYEKDDLRLLEEVYNTFIRHGANLSVEEKVIQQYGLEFHTGLPYHQGRVRVLMYDEYH